jgi:hypothetical protein
MIVPRLTPGGASPTPTGDQEGRRRLSQGMLKKNLRFGENARIAGCG